MELAVEQHRLESRTFEVKMNQVLSENERLLAQAIDHDIVKAVVNLSVNDGLRLKETVCRIRTDNGTEVINQTLREYYEKVVISHETSVARSPQQNGVVERRNRTLIEAARTMLIYAKAPLFHGPKWLPQPIIPKIVP
ncbi:putative ribonuclease H-like domain-containing protein [Tanacetum coccineum]|uniref:Ribonuclease H-like domain-containing protein n=1 Tax=Tanacetum coccineum TaxID=301880 RepID=A0ABQ4XUP5_9ASTR